ncbi:efflux RND transporter periplasmic adaptor subunit [Salmonella enterica]|nr:efflux RND transporter periplasmic adaptor subunit [Salmonella enterica]
MGGGFALGVGIWAMHFVGMLAMDHAMNMRFDPFLTGLSMLIAIGSSLFALWLVSAEKLRLRRLLPGALVMGLGISAMHYTGMAALQFASIIVWNSAWVALSIIIALLASCGALWLTFRLRHEGTDVALRRAGAAVLMGIAIAGMHYAGMKAAHFPQNWPMEHRGVDSNWLAVLVSVVALTILGITLLVSLFDARQADAAVVATKAAVESARINLAYTKVTSPISGRIGKSNVTEGALVTNGQSTELATVQQLDPIYVDVTQSSNDFMRLKQSVEQGNLHKDSASSTVQLVMENGQVYPIKGTLQFSDVTVDESTGSITLRAVFPNPQHSLLPGMFVRARIDEGVQPNAILVPQQGVTRTPRGDAMVMVVNDKSQVEARNVVAAQAIGDKWLISEGLKPGDKVIVSGLQKARPGVQVKATTDAPAAKTAQ